MTNVVNGQKVNYIHLRTLCADGISHNMGGATVAYIEREGYVVKFAVANCSLEDNFSRKTGREISSDRLNRSFLSRTYPKGEEMTIKDFVVMIENAWYGAINDRNFKI